MLDKVHSYIISTKDTIIPSNVIQYIQNNISPHAEIIDWVSKHEKEIDDIWDERYEIIGKISKSIRNNGIAILDNIGIGDVIDFRVRHIALYLLLTTISKPSIHSTNDIFWDVKDIGDQKNGKVITFSERYGECPLHTDSAFSEHPEHFLTLYVVKPANDGGESVYLSFKNLLHTLTEHKDGDKCRYLLENKDFPFMTPPSFNPNTPVILKPVFQDNRVRFRYDCLIDGLDKYPELRTVDRVWCIELLNELIENNQFKKIVSVQKDQMILIDNWHGFHARTHFEDKSRFLIRARLI